MDKQYRWQIDLLNASGPIGTGILEGDTNPHDTSATTGSANAKFYCIDSNARNASDWPNNQSRLVISVSTSWTASIDSRNYLTIVADTTITKVERDNILGNPNFSDNSPRNMSAHHYEGGPTLWSYTDTNIAVAKTIATNIPLGTKTFTLAPGSGESNYSMYFFNKNPNWQTDGDRLKMGVKFTNILPPDYRPGAIRDSNGVWQSHDRLAGTCHILTSGGTWREMRTIDGLTASGDPPAIRYNNKWMNMRNIGKE